MGNSKKGLLEEDDGETLGEKVLDPSKKAEIELNNYLSMPKVNRDTNPLLW